MSLTLRAKAVLPSPLWKFLKGAKRGGVRSVQSALSAVGLNVSRRSDYYSPLPVLEELLETQNQWKGPSGLRGLKFSLDDLEERLEQLSHGGFRGYAALAPYAQAREAGFGPGYPEIDAMILFSLLRQLKPTRYLEVGSGLSTYYTTLAATQNAREGRPMKITCIEPFPYPRLCVIPDIDVRSQRVQEIPIAEFEQLAAGDVLFIDSSHALKIGSDVAYLLMEVLPALAPGVWIHIHDIPFPYNIPYPPEFWILQQNWPMYWNEAMVVQAFLAFNTRFEIWLSVPLLRYFREESLYRLIPEYPRGAMNAALPSSLWLRC
jgi:hypothetical protein